MKKIDRLILEYQEKKQAREKDGPIEEQSLVAFQEELNWLSGVIYGLKIAKNRVC